MRSSASAWRPISNARAHDPVEQQDHDDHADKAEFLADHRENEVGMRFGQIVELLDAAAEAHAEPLAAPERNQRERQLIRLALRVAVVPRIEVREDPLARATATPTPAELNVPTAVATSPPNSLPFTPPRNSRPIAIAAITMNAPMSGSSSSNAPTEADRHRHRQKAVWRSCA